MSFWQSFEGWYRYGGNWDKAEGFEHLEGWRSCCESCLRTSLCMYSSRIFAKYQLSLAPSTDVPSPLMGAHSISLLFWGTESVAFDEMGAAANRLRGAFLWILLLRSIKFEGSTPNPPVVVAHLTLTLSTALFDGAKDVMCVEAHVSWFFSFRLTASFCFIDDFAEGVEFSFPLDDSAIIFFHLLVRSLTKRTTWLSKSFFLTALTVMFILVLVKIVPSIGKSYRAFNKCSTW